MHLLSMPVDFFDVFGMTLGLSTNARPAQKLNFHPKKVNPAKGSGRLVTFFCYRI